ncbi:MAG TPA: glycosyltransferase family 2 protein [bacterium]|nr:glycosyltransferase family 2 protein [bacterium]HPN32023.1 glycosyltransferase family 2 protein [bacterium]
MNDNNKFVSVVIPAYNEENSIAAVVSKIKQLDNILEILVIDDGSSDNTAIKAEEAGAIVIKQPYNIGNGAAIKKGIFNARGLYVLCMDADMQHPPEEIPNMIKHSKEYDMIVGARTSESGVSKFRGFGNYFLIKIAEFISGYKILDLTSGFRMINREKCLKVIHLFPNQYSYPTTVTLAFFNNGYSIKYLPMKTITKRTTGKSNIKPFRDGIRFIMIIIRIVMLFNPLKIFLPISFILFLAGIIQTGYAMLILKTGIKQASIIFFVSSILILCFAMLAEQISQLRKNLYM